MQFRIILTLICFLFSLNAQADIVIKLLKNDTCESFAGKWSGDGEVEVSSPFGPITCNYNGDVDIGRVTKNSLFNAHVHLYGSICPEQNVDLQALCTEGQIVISMPDKANLSGSTDGQTAHLSGTVVVDDNTAEVKRIDLQKSS